MDGEQSGNPLLESSVVRTNYARDAFANRDPLQSKAIHDALKLKSANEDHQKGGDYVKSMVFGGMDGIITTFAVVAGAAGANLGTNVILIMGFSNLVADGLSMGLGDFISSTAENDYVASELARETWEFENYPAGEKAEMVDLYEAKGFNKEDATELVDILSRNKTYFIENMMVEELGLLPPDPEDSPAKHGLVTFLAFCVMGIVPLLTFMVAAIIQSSQQSKSGPDFMLLFGITCALTVLAMFGLGVISSIFSIDPWWKCGLFTLANGAVASGLAYLIGWLVGLIMIAMGLPPIVV